MRKALDAHSFFLFSEIWGAFLLLSLWLARRAIPVDPTTSGISISIPFAIVMLGAMLRRLRDLRWSWLLLLPICLEYILIVSGLVISKGRWPVGPLRTAAVLGIYSGFVWLLISVTKGPSD